MNMQTPIQPKAAHLKMSREKTRALAFRGHQSTNTKTTLSPHESAQLTKLGIEHKPELNYKSGLVTTSLRDRSGPRRPDVVKLDNHMEQKFLKPDPELLACYQTLHDRLCDIHTALKTSHTSSSIKPLINQRKQVFSQIGLLFLPSGFLEAVEAPEAFISNTAVAVGMYAVSRMQNAI